MYANEKEQNVFKKTADNLPSSVQTNGNREQKKATLKIVFHFDVEPDYLFDVHLWSCDKQMAMESTKNNNFILIENYLSEQFVLFFILQNVQDSMLILRYINSMSLNEVLSSENNNMKLILKAENRTKEVNIKIEVLQVENPNAVEKDLQIRFNFENFVMQDDIPIGPALLEFFLIQRRNDQFHALFFIEKTLHMIASNIQFYSFHHFLKISSNCNDILIVKIRPFRKDKQHYFAMFEIDQLFPFQKEKLKLKVFDKRQFSEFLKQQKIPMLQLKNLLNEDKFGNIQNNFTSFISFLSVEVQSELNMSIKEDSKLQFSHPLGECKCVGEISIATFTKYTINQNNRTLAIVKFLQSPSDKFYLEIKNIPFKLNANCLCDIPNTEFGRMLEWISTTSISIDFSYFPNELLLIRCMIELKKEKLLQLVESFSKEKIVEIYKKCLFHFSTIQAIQALINLMEIANRTDCTFIKELYEMQSNEHKLLLEATLAHKTDIVGNCSNIIPFSEIFKNQTIISFLPDGTFPSWVKLNFLPKQQIVDYLRNNRFYKELAIYHEKSHDSSQLWNIFNLYANAKEFHEAKRIANIIKDKSHSKDLSDEISNILSNQYDEPLKHFSNYNYYKVQFIGNRFPCFLQSLSFVYQSSLILSEVIDEIQHSFPHVLIQSTTQQNIETGHSETYTISISKLFMTSLNDEFYLVNTKSNTRQYLKTLASFPHWTHVIPITEEREEVFSPIVQAIETLQMKNSEINDLIGKNCSAEYLKLVVNGCLFAPINGGITKYEELLNGFYSSGNKSQLRSLIAEHETIIQRASQLLTV